LPIVEQPVTGPEELLSSGQAARLIGASQQSISKWAAAGVFHSAFRTPGGHGEWRIPRSAVLALRQRGQAEPA
jgi:hypothetical protein